MQILSFEAAGIVVIGKPAPAADPRWSHTLFLEAGGRSHLGAVGLQERAETAQFGIVRRWTSVEIAKA